MKLLKYHTHIVGFEDYRIIEVQDGCFYSTWGFYVPYKFDDYTGSYIINKNNTSKAYNEIDDTRNWIQHVKFSPELVRNHKELLNTAKKVYTHPSCTLSRSLMAEKYKKSLNPFLSDAVIIPKPNYNELSLRDTALFINEKSKMIVYVDTMAEDAKNRIKSVSEGTKFKDAITSNPDYAYSYSVPYTIDDMLEAELFYYGEVLCVPNSQSWVIDALANRLPLDKIVFENSVQDSLSSETNQLDFDSLCSIKDMLESSDENTVSAGLKSLSMMDWMHYPQSVKYIIKNINSYRWRYNNACNSTSVKYMMKTLSGNQGFRRSWWPGDYDFEIYEKDFELFKRLKCHYENILPHNILNYIRYMNFINVTPKGLIVPVLKKAM